MPPLPFFSYTFLTQTYPDIHNSPKVILTLCDRLTYSPSEFPLHLTIVVFCKVQFLQLFSSNLFGLITGRSGQGFGPLVTSVQCMAIRKLHSSKEYTKCISPNCQMFFSKLQDVFALIAKYMLGLWSLMCSG